jgi:hypothetical protein
VNKNEASRLRKASACVERVLDNLNIAQGQLYPAPLREWRDQFTGLIRQVEQLAQKIEAEVPPLPVRAPDPEGDEGDENEVAA